MARAIYLVAMAGGMGTRMGGDTLKQFLTISGKPILHITLDRFVQACPDIKIVTVLPEVGIKIWKDYCLTNNVLYPQTIVQGGITRFHSVKNAMEVIPDGAIVIIHDGVRPLVSVDFIRQMLSRMGTATKALIPVVPSVDTLKAAKPGNKKDEIVPIYGQTYNREEVYCAQTPQIFRSEYIKKAYQQPYDTSFTDDASVAEAYEIPLTYCKGERYNIKITTKEDLIIAQALLLSL